MSLKRNVVANYLGQGWRALMGIAFIPLYIHYLGAEAYGMIGVFAILQACLTVFDMGMRPALGREMARFTGGAQGAHSIRDLLRSVEILAITIGGAVSLGVAAASDWLASDWLTTRTLPVDVVSHGFTVMAAIASLQFIESIYVSSIAGLQRQVTQNTLTSVMATLRGLGAAGILAWVSPTIDAFLIWQGVISLVSVALFANIAYRALPPTPRPARFSKTTLGGIGRFAGGTTVITILAVLLTQTDKILLSRLLSLEDFAHYTLAAVMANALYTLVQPVSAAFYPRFVELVARGDEPALRGAYHQGAQLVTVLLGTATVMLTLFGDRALLLWTADPALTHEVAPLVKVLALGTLFNGLIHIPYHMQLAHAWTTLTTKVHTVAVIIFVPAIFLIVPKYSAIGAAWVWVILNAGYLLFYIYFMHLRLLPAEKWRWYRQDIFFPLSAAAATGAFCRSAMADDLPRLTELSVLLVSSAGVLLAAAFTAPLVRGQLWHYLHRGSEPTTTKILT